MCLPPRDQSGSGEFLISRLGEIISYVYVDARKTENFLTHPHHISGSAASEDEFLVIVHTLLTLYSELLSLKQNCAAQNRRVANVVSVFCNASVVMSYFRVRFISSHELVAAPRPVNSKIDYKIDTIVMHNYFLLNFYEEIFSNFLFRWAGEQIHFNLIYFFLHSCHRASNLLLKRHKPAYNLAYFSIS